MADLKKHVSPDPRAPNHEVTLGYSAPALHQVDHVGAPPQDDIANLLGAKSPGVARIEALSAHFTLWDRVALFVGVFIIAYSYSLDSTIRGTYQSYALSGYELHSAIATVNTVRTVIAAAAQPTAAKIADVFGRVELVLVSIFFYTLGTVIEASTTGVAGFCAGSLLYQIGFTCVILLVEVIIADTTSLRSRLLFSYIPALPFLINTWVAGDVAETVLEVTGWRWGIGMWAIIYPVTCIPIIGALLAAGRRARKAGAMDSYRTPYQRFGAKKLAVALFWQLDVIGLILMIAVFALILTPFTLAGGETMRWKEAHVIAPLVVGLFCIPLFVWWERRSRHPLVPLSLLKDRAVWGALGIAWMLNFAWYMQGDYLFSVLRVAFDESIKSATRIASLYSFSSVITGCIIGFIVRFRIPYLKPFIVAGTTLFLVAFGLLIRYRGGTGEAYRSGIIGAQILLGIAGGMFPYPTQASIQSATKHEHVAIITGLYLATYNIGSAFGSTVSGAIWTQVLPGEISSRMTEAEFGANATTLVTYAYASPLQFILEYPVGTPERGALIGAYRHTQRLLCITGMCLSVVIITFSLCLRNPKLGEEQSLPDAEVSDASSRGEGSVDGLVAPGSAKGGFFARLWK